MSYFIILLAVLLPVVSAGKIPYTDCGNPKCISEVRVTGCDMNQCKIKKNVDFTIEADFTSNQDTALVNITLWARMDGDDVKIPYLDGDGCAAGRLPCPLKKDQKYTLKYTLKIWEVAPTMSTVVTAKVNGDKGLLGCAQMKGEIVD